MFSHVYLYILSDNFPIQNGLKQGDALSLLLFNFPSEYAIRKFQETKVGLKLNGTHYLQGVQPVVLAYTFFIVRQNTTIINNQTG
jgi:hypothetical protein